MIKLVSEIDKKYKQRAVKNDPFDPDRDSGPFHMRGRQLCQKSSRGLTRRTERGVDLPEIGYRMLRLKAVDTLPEIAHKFLFDPTAAIQTPADRAAIPPERTLQFAFHPLIPCINIF